MLKFDASVMQVRMAMGLSYPASSFSGIIRLDVNQFEICDACKSSSSIYHILSHRLSDQGKGKSTKEVLKRIDYGGSFTLLGAVCTF